MAECPSCTEDVGVGGDVRVNEIVECGECLSELEVVSAAPLMLALAPEVEEDWGE
ncbi:MAG TPA: hypothetical protein VFU12_14525 [Glycomyces sp.]|nr:hypothetical protein [Glycomyces sp.]